MSLHADRRLTAIAAAQHGVFGRAQAIRAGLTKAQIDRRLRAARWVRVFPRVYRDATDAWTAVSPLWAAVLWAGPGCALSHRTAALLWRLEPVVAGPTELLVPARRAPRVPGLVVHRAETAHDVVRVEGLPVTTPPRTLIDLAGVVDDEELGVAIASACLHGLVTVAALLAHLEGMGSAGRPGAARVRRVARALDRDGTARLEAEVAHLLRARRLRAPVRRAGAFVWPAARVVLTCGARAGASRGPGWRVLAVTSDDLARPDALVARLVRALCVPAAGASR